MRACLCVSTSMLVRWGHTGSYFTQTPLCLPYTAATALPCIPCACVRETMNVCANVFMCTRVSVSSNLFFSPVLNINDWCDIGQILITNPAPHPPSVNYSVSRWVFHHIIVHELQHLKYDSWLRGTKDTPNWGRLSVGVLSSLANRKVW